MPGSDFDALRRQALDTFKVKYSICNVLHGSIALFNEDMAAALCAAVNDWTVKELLDRDPACAVRSCCQRKIRNLR